MGIFDYLGGSVCHYNTVASSAFEDIFKGLEKLDKTPKKEILLKLAALSHGMVEYMFNPNDGVLRKKVKEFNRDNFFMLYEYFILSNIFTLTDYLDCVELKNIFANAIRRETECEKLYSDFENSKKSTNENPRDLIWRRIEVVTGPLDGDVRESLSKNHAMSQILLSSMLEVEDLLSLSNCYKAK